MKIKASLALLLLFSILLPALGQTKPAAPPELRETKNEINFEYFNVATSMFSGGLRAGHDRTPP